MVHGDSDALTALLDHSFSEIRRQRLHGRATRDLIRRRYPQQNAGQIISERAKHTWVIIHWHLPHLHSRLGIDLNGQMRPFAIFLSPGRHVHVDAGITEHPTAAVFLNRRGYNFAGAAACFEKGMLTAQRVRDDVLALKLGVRPISTTIDAAADPPGLSQCLTLATNSSPLQHQHLQSIRRLIYHKFADWINGMALEIDPTSARLLSLAPKPPCSKWRSRNVG